MDSAYKSKQANAQGVIEYTSEENNIWRDLYHNQIKLIPRYACQEYQKGLEILDLPQDRIPQTHEVSSALNQATGWGVAGVAALISYSKFFNLLAERKFPVATFIRSRDEFNYLQEPDIFHEIFGHCPLLTHPIYADFMQAYGKLGASADEATQTDLARLYWFTVEFGLIKADQGLRCYGAGLLSSPGEAIYAIDSDTPIRYPFRVEDCLRTPYRIDIYQPLYFVIENFTQIFELLDQDLFRHIQVARAQGKFAPLFKPKFDS